MSTSVNSYVQSQSLKAHMLRFSLVSSLVLILAVSIEWSMSYVTAIFVTQLLLPGKPPLNLALVKTLVLAVLSCFVIGLTVVLIAQPYPLLLFIILAWCLFYVFYRANKGLNELVVLFLLVALIALPIIANISRAVASGFVIDFMFAFVLALLIVAFVHWLMPLNDDFHQAAAKPEAVCLNHQDAMRQALVSTVVLFPLIIYFYAFNNLDDLLVVIFVAILAQNPELVKGAKASIGIVFTNIVGGAIALVVFNLLVAIPQLGFMALLVTLSFMLIAQFIYLHPKGGIVVAGLSAFIIIIGSTIGSEGGLANEKFVVRIIQLSAVGIYIISSFYLVHKLNYFKPRERY